METGDESGHDKATRTAREGEEPSVNILSPAEIAACRTDGVVVPEFRLSPDTLAHLQSLAARLIAGNPHMGDEPVASPHVPGSGVQNVKSDPAWIDIPTFAPILDMMEQLIGPDVILWGTTLFHKPAGLDRGVPWHRDGRYWPIKPLATTTVWIAVTDCTKENGCLRVIPGSHAACRIGRHFRDDSDRVTIPETLCDDEFDPDAARDLELEAGQMAVFDIYMIHGSNPNPTAAPRIGYALRYMPATSHYDHHDLPIADSRGSAHHTRPLIQVRGRDVSGLNDFAIGHPRPFRSDPTRQTQRSEQTLSA